MNAKEVETLISKGAVLSKFFESFFVAETRLYAYPSPSAYQWPQESKVDYLWYQFDDLLYRHYWNYAYPELDGILPLLNVKAQRIISQFNHVRLLHDGFSFPLSSPKVGDRGKQWSILQDMLEVFANDTIVLQKKFGYTYVLRY